MVNRAVETNLETERQAQPSQRSENDLRHTSKHNKR